jgi:hypothetical protein
MVSPQTLEFALGKKEPIGNLELGRLSLHRKITQGSSTAKCVGRKMDPVRRRSESLAAIIPNPSFANSKQRLENIGDKLPDVELGFANSRRNSGACKDTNPFNDVIELLRCERLHHRRHIPKLPK